MLFDKLLDFLRLDKNTDVEETEYTEEYSQLNYNNYESEYRDNSCYNEDNCCDYIDSEEKTNEEISAQLSDIVKKCHILADLINTTTDEEEFYDCIKGIRLGLKVLQNFEGIIDFKECTPTENLKEIDDHMDDTIALFKKRVEDKKETNPFYDNIRNFWLKYPNMYNSEENKYRDASPEEYYLYGKTLLLDSFKKCTEIRKSNEYSTYFMMECHMTDARNFIISLIEEGYLVKPDDYDFLISFLASDLKTICESLGCKKSGTKPELVHRILSLLSKEDIEKHKNDSECYILSEKGRYFLQINNDYVWLHKNRELRISLAEFNDYRYVGNKRRTYEDTIFHVISDKIYKNSVDHYYHMMKDYYDILCNIYLEDSIYNMAVDSCIRSIYMRTCYIYEAELYSHNIYNPNKVEYTVTYPINPKIMKNVSSIAKYYSKEYVSNVYNLHDLPPNFLTEDEFINMMNDMCTSTVFDYGKYNKLLCERLNEYIEYNSD